MLSAANHGSDTIFLEGGFDIELSSGYRALVREVEGIPLLKRELRPGESIEIPYYPDEMSDEELRTFEKVYVRDQIGRQYSAAESDVLAAVEKYIKSRALAESEKKKDA